MTKQLLGLGLSLGCILSFVPTALAVQPAPVQQSANVQWSTVIDDPFDGQVVYDKHYTKEFAFVSSWSRQGIRATYTEFHSKVTGYQTVWRTRQVCRDYDRKGNCRHYRDERYPDQEAIRDTWTTESSPQSILFALQGKIYTYESGPVSPELAAALASAPPGNLRIRLVWKNNSTTDMEIGKGTVEAWKTLFRSVSRSASSQ